jgi:hypothetical protein
VYYLSDAGSCIPISSTHQPIVNVKDWLGRAGVTNITLYLGASSTASVLTKGETYNYIINYTDYMWDAGSLQPQ